MTGIALLSLLAASTTVLFVGNSYTFANGGIWIQAKEIYDSVSSDTLTVLSHTAGGASFQNHWNSQELKNILESGNIDIAVFQEQSCMPVINPSLTYQYGDSLALFCQANGIQPAFMMTWARKNDPLMLQGLSAGYSRMGMVHSSIVAPCGIAFELLRRDYPEIDPYDNDGAHPSENGSYLASCVICSSVLEADLYYSGIWLAPGVSEEDGALLRETAVSACSLYMQPMEAMDEI